MLSLILKRGTDGVRFVYGYDATETWILNPATREDGEGYWINMKAYDVMMFSGLPNLNCTWWYAPTPKWHLVGYTCTIHMSVYDYLSSLPNGTYFRYIYAWNAAAQSLKMLDRQNGAHTLTPGQAFWILVWSAFPVHFCPPVDCYFC